MHGEAAVLAGVRLQIFEIQLAARLDQRHAGFLALRVSKASYFHFKLFAFGGRMRFQKLRIVLQSGDQRLLSLNLFGIIFEKPVFQAVVLGLETGAEHFQLRHLDVEIHLFLDARISGRQRFDFRVRKDGLVHVLAAARRRLARHNLRDEFGLVLDKLPVVTVKCVLRHIAEYFDLRVAVSLPEDTPLALLDVPRLPRAVEMMLGDQAVLHVGARPHLCGGAEKNPHLAFSDFGKQPRFLHLRLRVVDVGDFLRGDTLRGQLVFDVVIHIERTVIVRRREIAKSELRSPGRPRCPPHVQDVFDAGVDFASRIVRQQRVHQALVKRQRPPVARDLEKVVLRRIDKPVSDVFRAVPERLDALLLNLARFCDHVDVLRLRHRQLQHVGRLDVCRLFPDAHQLRQVKEMGEPRLRAESGSFRSQLRRRHGFSERCRPVVEIAEAEILQGVVLQITHHRIKLDHGVADRRAGGERGSPAAGQLVHVSAFCKHVGGLLRFRLTDARHIPHFCVEE